MEMVHDGDEAPILIAQSGPLNGRRWSLRTTFLLGREPGCDIAVEDRQVSRYHARITPSPRGVILEDLGSKNGTHRNGELLHEPVVLQDGDVIQIALAQQFLFLNSDATIPLDADEIDVGAFQPASVAVATGAGLVTLPGRLRMDKRSRRVWIGNKEVLPPLSVSQFKLLELLYEHQGRVVPRERLIADVWGDEQAVAVSEQALDALVRRLRDRLANIDSTHNYIATLRGHGLRLDNPPLEEK